MTPALQIALTATPLAAYFYTLASFHASSRPRMVDGPVDVALLAAGLGGLVTFGPFGRAVLGRLAGDPPGALGWSTWLILVGLWTMILAGSASLRVTVYHATSAELVKAVGHALAGLGGDFAPTLNGFEDRARGAGVAVKPFRLLRSGSVEVYGRDPDTLIRELKPRLREALDRIPRRPSGVAHAMLALASLTMFLPVSSYFVANPRAKEALRTLMHSLRWW